METRRIELLADPETTRRLEAAAAKHKMTVAQYCLDAIRQQLADDADDEVVMTTAAHVSVPLSKQEDSVMARLQRLHQEILVYRDGAHLDVDEELERMRKERDDELTGLR